MLQRVHFRNFVSLIVLDLLVEKERADTRTKVFDDEDQFLGVGSGERCCGSGNPDSRITAATHYLIHCTALAAVMSG
jgi:hypothetical protein